MLQFSFYLKLLLCYYFHSCIFALLQAFRLITCCSILFDYSSRYMVCVIHYAIFWWAFLELNQAPHAYQACALTN